MKWILGGIVLVLAVALLTIWIIGRSIPLAHSATASRTIQAPADRLWTMISDLEQWKSWRTDLKSLEVLSDERVEVTDRFGTVQYRIEKPGDRTLVTIIDQEGLPYGGRWTWVVEPSGDGAATVTLTEEGEIYIAFFRFMARYVFGYDSTMRSILDQLEASAREKG